MFRCWQCCTPCPPYTPCGRCCQMSLPPGPPYALWCRREDWYIILKRVEFGFRLVEVGILSGCSILLIKVVMRSVAGRGLVYSSPETPGPPYSVRCLRVVGYGYSVGP